MYYHTTELACGLRIVHLPSTSPVSYCGFAVNCGTRDETSNQFGMAHFVEHLLFKGTQKRRSWHILNRMERVGGELNAFTTKEETTYYSVFPDYEAERAIELLCDIVLDSQFPEHEVEKEVEVIADEINSYKDNPSELIYDEFENQLYEDHAMGHFILGDDKSLENFTSHNGLQFFHTHYIPTRMVFFSMGRTSFSKIVRLVSKYYHSPLLEPSLLQRMAPTSYLPKHCVKEIGTYQSHVIVGAPAYHLHHTNRPAVVLLNNILGGPGMNSRLNLSLRERHGYVYNVESAITAYTDTGIFSIYYGCDPKNRERCMQLVQKELHTLTSKSLSSLQVDRAKKQLKGQMLVATDNPESTALDFSKSMLHFGIYNTMQEAYDKLDAVTPSQLLEVANDIFASDQLSYLSYT